MDWIIHYNVCATILILIISINFYKNQKFPSTSNYIFGILLLFSAIACISDIFAVFVSASTHKIPIWFIYSTNIIYLAFFNALSFLYYNYLISITIGYKQLHKLQKMIDTILVVSQFLLIVTTPFTKLIFSIDDNGYHRESFFICLYLIASYFLLLSLLITIKYHKTLDKIQILSTLFFTIACTGAVLIQAYQPHILISNFCVAISMLLMYLSLQNPESYNDKLTQTFNQKAFIDYTNILIHSKKPFMVIAIELDEFKFINETLGVENGDLLKKVMAQYFLRLYSSKNVFHIFASRFALILDASYDFELVLNNLKEHFRSALEVNGIDMMLTPLICYIQYPENAHTTDDILDMIEFSLLAASKNEGELIESSCSGTSCIVIHADENMLAKKRRETAIDHIVKRAVHNNEFEVYYQPIYSTKLKQFISAEALIRLKDEELGFISPDEFIPIAEMNGTILQIGTIVFRAVCELIKKQELWKFGIQYIEVNLSVVQCMQEDLSKQLLAIMKEYEVPHSMINLEITETAAVHSTELLLTHMHSLIQRGFTFALDDYGSGFSTTSYLIDFPFHLVKIDKSIVWAAMEDVKAGKILSHTASMIKSLDMGIVAEGVETKEQSHLLIDMGCDYLQGYYFSKPLPANEFCEFLVTHIDYEWC